MKKFILLITMCFISICAKTQSMGEIILNSDFTATLQFGDEVDFVVIGNNPIKGMSPDKMPIYKYYDIFQSTKNVVLRGNDPSAPKTSLTVKLKNGSVYFGTLQFGSDAKIFYDFAKEEKKQVHNQQLNDSITQKVTELRLQDKVKYVMEQKQVYTDQGISENNLIVQVTNIMNDDKNTYLKIVFINESGSDYNIDNIIFKYVEGKKKGLKKKEAKIEERINPVYEPDDKVVKAYSTSELGYAIPIFTVGEKGNLAIQMLEKNGTRNLKIEVEGETMLKVKAIKF